MLKWPDIPSGSIPWGGIWGYISPTKIMQAILTKYLPVTESRGSRIKASCERGSIVIPYPHELSGDECHRAAVQALLDKFTSEDEKSGRLHCHWNKQFVTGALPNGDYCHVLI